MIAGIAIWIRVCTYVVTALNVTLHPTPSYGAQRSLGSKYIAFRIYACIFQPRGQWFLHSVHSLILYHLTHMGPWFSDLGPDNLQHLSQSVHGASNVYVDTVMVYKPILKCQMYTDGMIATQCSCAFVTLRLSLDSTCLCDCQLLEMINLSWRAARSEYMLVVQSAIYLDLW